MRSWDTAFLLPAAAAGESKAAGNGGALTPFNTPATLRLRTGLDAYPADGGWEDGTGGRRRRLLRKDRQGEPSTDLRLKVRHAGGQWPSRQPPRPTGAEPMGRQRALRGTSSQAPHPDGHVLPCLPRCRRPSMPRPSAWRTSKPGSAGLTRTASEAVGWHRECTWLLVIPPLAMPLLLLHALRGCWQLEQRLAMPRPALHPGQRQQSQRGDHRQAEVRRRRRVWCAHSPGSPSRRSADSCSGFGECSLACSTRVDAAAAGGARAEGGCPSPCRPSTPAVTVQYKHIDPTGLDISTPAGARPGCTASRQGLSSWRRWPASPPAAAAPRMMAVLPACRPTQAWRPTSLG